MDKKKRPKEYTLSAAIIIENTLDSEVVEKITYFNPSSPDPEWSSENEIGVKIDQYKGSAAKIKKDLNTWLDKVLKNASDTYYNLPKESRRFRRYKNYSTNQKPNK